MWPNPQETAELVSFTDEILNGKLHFLCSDFEAMSLLKNKNTQLRLKFSGFNQKWKILTVKIR